MKGLCSYSLPHSVTYVGIELLWQLKTVVDDNKKSFHARSPFSIMTKVWKSLYRGTEFLCDKIEKLHGQAFCLLEVKYDHEMSMADISSKRSWARVHFWSNGKMWNRTFSVPTFHIRNFYAETSTHMLLVLKRTCIQSHLKRSWWLMVDKCLQTSAWHTNQKFDWIGVDICRIFFFIFWSILSWPA